MPAISLSSVLLPEPLRPTIPKNSPWSTANETSRTASNSSKLSARNGWSARSLSVCICSCGRRNVFETPSTTMAGPLEVMRSMIAGALSAAAPARRRMSVSVVIPTYNRVGEPPATCSRRCGARRCGRSRSSSSTARRPTAPRRTSTSLGDAVRRVDNPERNLSRSRNLGIAAAAGELVAFLDDDAMPEPRWLEELVAPFDDDAASPAPAGSCSTTPACASSGAISWCRAPASTTSTQRRRSTRFVAPGADPFLYVAGGNCAFRRDALVAVGGFDEEIEYNFDEAEVCLRLLDAGWRLASLERRGGPPPQPAVAPALGGARSPIRSSRSRTACTSGCATAAEAAAGGRSRARTASSATCAPPRAPPPAPGA